MDSLGWRQRPFGCMLSDRYTSTLDRTRRLPIDMNMTSPSFATAPALHSMVAALDASPLISYVSDSQFRIVYCNPAWDRFAIENQAPELAGGRVLGSDLRSALGKDLLPFYVQAFDQVRLSGVAWEWIYECSSAELFRKFQMRVLPLQDGGWLLVTNARIVEHLHPPAMQTALDAYRSPQGMITICSHCRRSRRMDHPAEWDFIPSHIERGRTDISHGLCPICLDYFYGPAMTS